MDGLWVEDTIAQNVSIKVKVQDIYFVGSTTFQSVKLCNSEAFGKLLLLDNKVQSSQVDEFIYHESLVQPSMLLHKNPKKVFIGGGGELATAREVLRHSSVEKLVMVDIDEKVVRMCNEHLPEWGQGAMKDPRIELIYDDALKTLEEYPDKFDVIIMDINDPIDGGPGLFLYTQEFYRSLSNKLNPGGIFVTQGGGADYLLYKQCYTTVVNTMKSSFKTVFPYSVHIPSFGGCWGFCMGMMHEVDTSQDPTKIGIDEMDALIASRFDGETPFRHFEGSGGLAMFRCQKFLREGIANETQIMTRNNLIYMHSESK